jgi:hypothetical protein
MDRGSFTASVPMDQILFPVVGAGTALKKDVLTGYVSVMITFCAGALPTFV